MLKNYLIVAFRNFRRNKIFSLINVLGLSIGISASLVIFLIVQYDFSFDRFENNGNRIYRVVSEYSFQGNPGNTRGVPAPLADAVKKELSGVDQIVSFRYIIKGFCKTGCDRLYHRYAAFLVGHPRLVGKFRIQDTRKLVDFPGERTWDDGYCIGHLKRSNDPGRNGQSSA